MAQVDSVDFENKRIYLHQDTVTQGFDPIAAHFEIKVIVQQNANGEQNFVFPTAAEGNLPKGGGRFTATYLFSEPSWRFVPYGGVGHSLELLNEIVSADQLTDRDVFDRSAISVNVDIDPIYTPIEVVTAEASITPDDLEGLQVDGLPDGYFISTPLELVILSNLIPVGESFQAYLEPDIQINFQDEQFVSMIQDNFDVVSAGL